MSLVKLVISIFLSLIWISDSMLINFVQLLLYNLLRPVNRRLYRKLNYYLIYTSWCQIVALAQYMSKCKIILHFPDEESKNKFGREFNLTLMNHKYEVDWLYSWLAMDHFENLGVSSFETFFFVCLCVFYSMPIKLLITVLPFIKPISKPFEMTVSRLLDSEGCYLRGLFIKSPCVTTRFLRSDEIQFD